MAAITITLLIVKPLNTNVLSIAQTQARIVGNTRNVITFLRLVLPAPNVNIKHSHTHI